jgi:hypothetical protein
MIDSDKVHSEIDGLLLSGAAQTMAEAENRYLDDHLEEIARLAETLSPEEFRRHEAVKLLMAHGSRPWEDSVR